MQKKTLFILWAALYAVCAGLGFIPAPAGALRLLMILLAIACFVPPLLLIRQKDPATVRLIRSLAALWLVLTIVFMNFVGPILYFILGKEDS